MSGPSLSTRHSHSAAAPGSVGGLHHSSYVSSVRALKATLQWRELEHLLLHLVEATEVESRKSGCAVAAVYYRELACLYRRDGDPVKELGILKRFSRVIHDPSSRTTRLLQRLRGLERGLARESQPSWEQAAVGAVSSDWPSPADAG